MRLATAAACVILLFAASSRADDKPKPNTLTPKEIADGWLLLFDGETTFGWKIDGAAEVKDGVLILGKGKKTIAYPTTNFGDRYIISYEWQGQGTAIVGKYVINFEQNIGSSSWPNNSYQEDGKAGVLTGNGGVSVINPMSVESRRRGDAPLHIATDGETPATLRSVKLRPLASKPLFDGKALDGWKVNAADPKRVASKFEVTKDGELSVKNGPGDLVTEKEFDNFVLQFECKTLGDGLNSGFFFRCIPGQYQNGYEAQVQNSYLDNDRTKPKDFGTGAIYRRIAARKVVSNDKEWFTMTVVADGKHIATWVNGYQTVDWTDDRKESENPRQGYRAAKGPISIQGHDPTTDLLFRNIRLSELPGEKK
jgi:hypothetical protein